MWSLESSESLLKALAAVALKMQGVRTVKNVMAEAAGGMEALGFNLALFANVNGSFVPRYATQLPHTDAAMAALGSALDKHGTSELDRNLQTVLYAGQPVFVADAVAAVRALIEPSPWSDGVFEAVHEAGPWRGVVAPLLVRGVPWGAVAYVHRQLRPEHLETLNLFTLQLALSIEVAESIERLEKRNAELEMVRALAEAGPGADTATLVSSALAVLCWLTEAEAAVLYRVEGTSRYVIVGQPVGYPEPIPSWFKSFEGSEAQYDVTQPMRAPASSFRRSAAVLAEAGINQLALIPLTIEGKPVGLISMGRKSTVAFTDHEMNEATTVGVQLGALLERTRLYDQARAYYEELKASYQRLELAQQELVRHERLAAHGEVAAVMAHQVRNPLGVIFNSLATLKRLTPPTPEANTLLVMLEEEADRLNRIVSDLLDFVRPIELARQPIAIAPVVEAAIDVATQALGSGPVNVLMEVSETLPPFAVDSHLLRQALSNLIVNGLQSMPRGGQVRVTAAVEKRNDTAWLTLSVSDEGKGLGDPEKLFQPFFTTKAMGTGLGLAVVKRIVDAHSGDIVAHANPDGHGTTFVISLPGHTERSRGLTPPRAKPSAPRAAPGS